MKLVAQIVLRHPAHKLGWVVLQTATTLSLQFFNTTLRLFSLTPGLVTICPEYPGNPYVRNACSQQPYVEYNLEPASFTAVHVNIGRHPGAR